MGIARVSGCRYPVLFLRYSMRSDLSGCSARICGFSDAHLFQKQAGDH